MRVLGDHPELYPIALTRQLREMLDKYIQASKDLLAKRAASLAANPKAPVPSASKDEREILEQVVPERGWLVLTGRHRGDTTEKERESHDFALSDTLFDSTGALSLPSDHTLDSLVDEFPDDADYTEWDDTGALRKQKEEAKKKKKQRGLSPSPRAASRLNSFNAPAPTTSYGQIASKFLLAQTPSLQAIVTQQFDKTGPGGAAAVKSEYPAPIPGVSADEPAKRVRRPPPVVPKTDVKNEGMLIVRRPVLHFWLRCHAHVINWHASSPNTVVPAPAFLPKEQQGGWWRRLVEAIELQHGLATLQTSAEYAHSVEKESKRAQWQKRQRKAAGYVGTRRDGTRVEPQLDEPRSEAADEPVPDWSIRRKTQKQRW